MTFWSHQMAGASSVKSRIYGLPVREAQIIQEAFDKLSVRYVHAPGFSSWTEHSITEGLYARMGKVEVGMERVDANPRGPNGKFRAVISNLSKKELEEPLA
jgi:hypothetical protein